MSSFASTSCLSTSQKKTERTAVNFQSENLWNNFSPKKNNNFATPALNEFCEEYFQATKSPIGGEWSKHHSVVTSSDVLPNDFGDGAECHPQNSCITNGAEPPSYQYFYHDDVRIQKLVRQCLPNFVPLGDMKHIQNQQQNADTLDYMGQFGHRKLPCQVLGVGVKVQEGISKNRPRNQKNAKGKEVAEASGTWVAPKSCNVIPKDAGKRRVCADGHSFGHWYTGQDGRKVYVTKDGQELSGRIAYRHYMKESGAGFRSRKKTAGAPKKKGKK